MKEKTMNYIKSPLNYTGNKFRILDQIQNVFPQKIDCMVDLFCGGATVGLNVNAKKIYFIDNNERIINLLLFLSRQNFDDFLLNLEKLTEKYNLSYSYKYGYSFYRKQCTNLKDNNGLKDFNSYGFYKLRDHYNSLTDKNTDEANSELYLLMVYGFNNDIRFNSSGDFNLPVGKTDLNKMNVEKIKKYIERIKKVNARFLCADFSSTVTEKILKEADFIYMDPPYLLGDAVYNSAWDNQKEYDLLNFIDNLIENNMNFALSNVISKVGRTNEPLSHWCVKNEDKITITDINYNYKSSSYNKIFRNSKEREIVISNKRYFNNENQ